MNMYYLERTVCFCWFLHWSGGITWREHFVSASFCTGPVASPHLLGCITLRELCVSASFCTCQVVSLEENCFCQFLHQDRWYYLKKQCVSARFCTRSGGITWIELGVSASFCTGHVVWDQGRLQALFSSSPGGRMQKLRLGVWCGVCMCKVSSAVLLFCCSAFLLLLLLHWASSRMRVQFQSEVLDFYL